MAGFIIIKQYVHARGMFNVADCEYLRVTAKRNESAEGNSPEYKASWKKISRETARQMIRENGLKRALSCVYGDVYDTPTQDFLAFYGGNIEIPSTIGY